MKQKITNYTVKTCYVAQVPTLGIATEANSLEKVEKEIRSLIEFHLGSRLATQF